MFQESTIPPHAGIKTRLNRKFPPLEDAHIHVPRVLAPFAVPAGPKRVLVSSFGASVRYDSVGNAPIITDSDQGGNTCIILEECPISPDVSNGIKPIIDNRTHHVVAVSAKTQASLDGNRHRLLDYLRSHPGALVRDVAYTTTSRRMHHPLRLAFSVSSIEQLIQQLSQASGDVASRSSSARSKVIMMFPGQGVRLAGSGKVLYRTCSRFKQIISGLEGLCESLGLPSFLHILLSEESEAAAPVGPVATQLAIVALEIALAELLRSWGIIPDAVIGHSLGEYAALCVAGVLSVSDTLFLVGRRAELVEKLCSPGTHGMLAVALSADRCRSLIRDGQGGAAGCVVSCVNGPRSIVISGLHAELDEFQTAMNKEHPGTRSSKVATGYAFHSPQLDPIREPYLQLASAVRFSRPKVPVASTLFGRLVDGEGDDGVFCASYLVDHARQPVQFDAALRACEAAGLIDGSGILVEAGPDSLCLSMSRAILQKPGELLPCLKSSSSEGTWETVTNLMSRAYARGLPVNWEEYNKPYEQILELLDLPLYQFDQKDFWIPYKGGVAALQREVDELKLRLEQTSASSSAVAPEPIISSCLHSIARESMAQDRGTVLFKTDIQKQPIRDLIEGHNVVGVRLAPSSVYGEMAFSAACHVHSRLYPERKCPAMELRDCAISAPLILTPGTEPQEVGVEVVLEKATRLATVRISSDKEHARCTVVLLEGDEGWARDWSGKHYLIHERVQNLRAASQPAGSVHHIWRDMVYKIFAPVTNYAAAYWSIATVSVQQDFREAAMQLDMRDTPNGHSFTVDPCWLDAIAQAAGFMLNSNPAKPDDILYVSTGWQALRVSRALSSGTGYHCHVRANTCSADDATVLCDVTVFDDSDVLAAAEGLIFKRVRKAHLLALFGEPMEKTKPVSPANFSRMAHGAALVNTTPKNSLKEKRSGNPRTNARISALLDVIADEVGVSVSELADDSTLESLGVDSLLTISITSRLKTEMDIDFPAALMLGSTTISELRSSLPGSDTGSPSESEDEEGGRSSTVSQASPDTPLTSTSEISFQDLVEGLVTAVADEARIEPRLMSDDTLLAELGIDSLMSIAVSRTVQRGTGIELPASLLTDCATLGEAKKALRSMYGASEGK
jgi:iterative type I PKS product template protein